MPSSISSESGVAEFEQGEGGKQQETEQISNLKKEVRELKKKLKNVVNIKDSELQEVKRQMDEVKNGQIAQSNRLAQLDMVDRARRFYNTLPSPNSDRQFEFQGHKYSPDIEAFIRNGAAYCRNLSILRGPNEIAFFDYSPEFFDKLIKHIHETENPEEMIANLDIALDVNNPAPWPAVLVQLHIAELGLISKEQLEKDGVPTLKEEKVDYDDKVVQYTMSNKHNPEVRFQLCIHFEGGAKCYQQMTRFGSCRTDIITFAVPCSQFEQEGEKEEERICKLEAELEQMNAKNGNLEKEMGTMQKEVGALKGQLDTKNSELQQMNAKNGNLEKEMGALKDQLAELKNHQVDQVAAVYARILPAPDSDRNIHLYNGQKYTPELDIFLRYGAAYCNWLFIWPGGTIDGFVGYPGNFFDDLIKYYYETNIPGKAVRRVGIYLSLTNPAAWPTALLQSRAGEMKLGVLEVFNDGKWVDYILRNKHNPSIAFELGIEFDGNAICYQQMTSFVMRRQ